MHINRQRPVEVVLYLQGGAALGAFSAGAIIALCQHPDIKIVGISGTSINAVQGAVLAETLLTSGQEAVSDRLLDFWRLASDYQHECLPLWYHATQSWHSASRSMLQAGEGWAHACEGFRQLATLPARSVLAAAEINAGYFNNFFRNGVGSDCLIHSQRHISAILTETAQPWFDAFASFSNPQGIDGVQRLFRQAQNALVDDSRAAMSESPVLGLLEYIARRGNGIDFRVLQESGLFVPNASRVDPNKNVWTLTEEAGVFFRGNEITPAAIAASGALPGMAPYVSIGGQLHADGGLTANPLLVPPSFFGADNKAISVLIRARPEDAFPEWIPQGGERPSTFDQRRAFFNGLTDRQWRRFVSTQPGQKIVIQPNVLERDDHMMEPENNFGGLVVDRRIAAGFGAANHILDNMDGITHTGLVSKRPPSVGGYRRTPALAAAA
jgi:predicted acylesterase/phospholipase RssA